MKTRSKASSEYLHAKRRLYERYSLDISKSEYLTLCSNITRGLCIARQSNRITLWRLPIRDKKTIAVYDKLRHRIVSFLPAPETVHCPTCGAAPGVECTSTRSGEVLPVPHEARNPRDEGEV